MKKLIKILFNYYLMFKLVKTPPLEKKIEIPLTREE